jgi:hypothetical protein
MQLRAAALVLLACACEPGEPPEYLPLGGGGSRELDRGAFSSSDPAVLALATRDYSEEVCPCLCILGCPGREVTALRTEITYAALREGRATISGTTIEGEEIALDYKVERIRRFEVRVLRVEVNEDPGRVVSGRETVTVAAGERVLLEIDSLGESGVALGPVSDASVVVDDPAVATARTSLYARGWRATVTAVAPGQTTLRVVTPWASRDVPLLVR